MTEMTNEDIGVLRTRGMKVLHGSRGAETGAAFEPGKAAGRTRKASAEAGERRERTERSEPGGLAGWVLRLISRREGLREERRLRVLETQSLGGRRQLMLVVCDGERFLVGSGADRVDTIVRIGPTEKPVSTRCAPGIPVEEPCL